MNIKTIKYITYDMDNYRYTSLNSILEAINSNMELFVYFEDGTMKVLSELVGHQVKIKNKIITIQPARDD